MDSKAEGNSDIFLIAITLVVRNGFEDSKLGSRTRDLGQRPNPILFQPHPFHSSIPFAPSAFS
jgi:hypothetical protein